MNIIQEENLKTLGFCVYQESHSMETDLPSEPNNSFLHLIIA